jgi:hypothetical protein
MVSTLTLTQRLAAYEARPENVFARVIMLAEEDRVTPKAHWNEAGYRWFKSPNVIDLEKVRRLLAHDAQVKAAS